MDYKKKYEEALERAKKYYNRELYAECNGSLVEDIFPELKESEDERIRKALIHYFSEQDGILTAINGSVSVGDILAWLEKQSKKVDAIENFDTEFEKQVSHLIASIINKEHEYNEGFVKWTANTLLNYAKHELEKQDEQKHVVVPRFRVGDAIRPKGSTAEYTIESISGGCYHGKGWGLFIGCDEDYELVEHKFDENVESKFKTGDWIVYCNETVVLITGIKADGYIINKSGYIPFTCQGNMRLWEISDAKAGDVIFSNDGHGSDSIELIKSVYDKCINFWFCLSSKNNFKDYYYEVYNGNIPYTNFASRKDATPATRKQRDLLFAKMKEAGYEWSDKDRKLIKMK